MVTPMAVDNEASMKQVWWQNTSNFALVACLFLLVHCGTNALPPSGNSLGQDAQNNADLLDPELLEDPEVDDDLGDPCADDACPQDLDVVEALDALDGSDDAPQIADIIPDSLKSSDTPDGTQAAETNDAKVEVDETISPDAAVAPCAADGDCIGVSALKGCEVPLCDKASGKCLAQVAPKYWPCDDGDPCTMFTVCIAGKCNADSGEVNPCDDANPCTDDFCDTTQKNADIKTGCVHTAKDTGACNDGNACTDGDKCLGGKCSGKTTEACKCLIDDDCLPFEDGDLCNGKLKCAGKLCVADPASAVVCSGTLTDCQAFVCDPKNGQCKKAAAADGKICDDGNPCTKSSECDTGQCKGGVSVCACNIDSDCAVFDDNNACDGVLFCDVGKCKVKPGSSKTCPAKGGCVDNVCNAKTAKCEEKIKVEGASCEDGNPCTVGEACVNNICGGGTQNTCDDNNPCTSDFCATDCTHVPKSNLACEDGNLCTTGENCQAGVCLGGKAIDCDDKSVCTDDSCDSKTGCVHDKLKSKCDDGNSCTVNEACSNGSCVGGTPAACDDKNPCTIDSCDEKLGCQHKTAGGFCDTGDQCTSPGACQLGLCVPAKNKCVDCVVNNDCLAQDDGNMCNGVPVCKDGQCIDNPASAVVCDKAGDTDCVLTFCNPVNGLCQKASAPKGAPCDDKNPCTVKDVCQSGICKSGTPAAAGGANNCPGDVCGDGFCNKVNDKETYKNCPADCGTLDVNNCGDGKCEYLDENNTLPEDCLNCQADCGKCNGGCKVSEALYCGSNKIWSTASLGATDGVDQYNGGCNVAATGNEFASVFTAACDGPIDLTLTPQNPAQTLVVAVLDGTKGCAGASCMQASAPGKGVQKLSVDLKKGLLYYVVVDSGGKAGDYKIELGCNCNGPVVCGDGKCDAVKEDCTSCPKDCGACNPCGDGKCVQGLEDCKNCVADCGACAGCGDGKCLGGVEDCQNCAADCGACKACGDGKCDVLGGEDCTGCKLDCGVCPITCQPNPNPLSCGSVVKGGIAGVGSTSAINTWQCLAGNHDGKEQAYLFSPSCTGLGFAKVTRDPGQIGNIDILVVEASKTCDGKSCLSFGPMLNGAASATFQAKKGESYQIVLDSTPGATATYSLQLQCIGCTEGCGNLTCEAPAETCTNCSLDCALCASCGNKVCDASETCTSCAADCGICPYCGDGLCSVAAKETCLTCIKDCGACK